MTDPSELIGRIEVLEKRNRRLTAVVVLALTAVGALFIMGQAWPAQTIEAERFVLTDPTGRELAALHLNNGEPELAFNNPEGKTVVKVGLANGSAAVQLCDQDGTLRVALAVTDTEQGLAIVGSDVKKRLALSTINGVPGLSLYDKRGNGKAVFAVGDSGPGLILNGNDGKPRLLMGVGKGEIPAIELLNSYGAVTSSVPPGIR